MRCMWFCMVLQYRPAQPKHRSYSNITITFTAGQIELNGVELQDLGSDMLRYGEMDRYSMYFQVWRFWRNAPCVHGTWAAPQGGASRSHVIQRLLLLLHRVWAVSKACVRAPRITHCTNLAELTGHILVDSVIVLADFEGSLVLMRASRCSTFVHGCNSKSDGCLLQDS